MTLGNITAIYAAIVSTLVATRAVWEGWPYLTLEPSPDRDPMEVILVIHNPSRRQMQVSHVLRRDRGDDELRYKPLRSPDDAVEQMLLDNLTFGEKPFLYVSPRSTRRLKLKPIQGRTDTTLRLFWHRHGPYPMLPQQLRFLWLTCRIRSGTAEQLNEVR